MTFWGAQWWKDNALADAQAPGDVTAPASFKGFANNLNATTPFDAPFTTRTGNSSNPPPTIPAQMCVLVADMVVQSGSTITGDVIGVVLVNTDPGYEAIPAIRGPGQSSRIQQGSAVAAVRVSDRWGERRPTRRRTLEESEREQPPPLRLLSLIHRRPATTVVDQVERASIECRLARGRGGDERCC